MQTPVTVPKPFHLCLDDRVHERHKFDEAIRERIQAAERRKKEVAERREREEKEELKKYRKSLVFKVCVGRRGGYSVLIDKPMGPWVHP